MAAYLSSAVAAGGGSLANNLVVGGVERPTTV
jgi:hypothetical protein